MQTMSRRWRGTGMAIALATQLFTVTAQAAPVGPNIALGRPAVVSSSYNANTSGDKVVDGNIATYWRTQDRSKLASEQISIDLGASPASAV